MNVNLEKEFIKNFIPLKKQERILGLLKNRKKRDKLRKLLSHYVIFDKKNIILIEKQYQNSEDIYKLLTKTYISNKCYIISINNKLDGSMLPLKEALDKVVGKLLGGTIIIISEYLAYYEGEEYKNRYILYNKEVDRN